MKRGAKVWKTNKICKDANNRAPTKKIDWCRRDIMFRRMGEKREAWKRIIGSNMQYAEQVKAQHKGNTKGWDIRGAGYKAGETRRRGRGVRFRTVQGLH